MRDDFRGFDLRLGAVREVMTGAVVSVLSKALDELNEREIRRVVTIRLLEVGQELRKIFCKLLGPPALAR